MPSHQLRDLIDALRTTVGKPPFRRPSDDLRRECEAEGLADKDFLELLEAITTSKHNVLAGRSIRLLIPRENLSALPVGQILNGFSRTGSSFVRHCWATFLCACFEANILTLDGKDCLKSGYGVLFYFIREDRSQKALARLLYRITRECDVTPLRCRVLSTVLAKIGPNPAPQVALGELFVAFGGKVQFPAKENGLPGLSGLTLASRVKMHEKIMKDLEPDWTKVLRRHCDTIMVDSEALQEKHKPRNELEVALVEGSSAERKNGFKRPKLLDLGEQQLTDVIISDAFLLQEAFSEGDPHIPLTKDIQRSLVAHLVTWDGLQHQDATFYCLERFPFPPKPDQDIFERDVFAPLLGLFMTATSTFKFRLCRSMGKMLGLWLIKSEEMNYNVNSTFYHKLLSQLDECFVAILTLDGDEPLVQLGIVEFYTYLARSVLKRAKIFTSGPSLAVPPSQSLVLKLLLSSTAVGVECAGKIIQALAKVFRVEYSVGASLDEQNKKSVAERFETLTRDVVKALTMRFGRETFEDFLNNDLKESGLEFEGDEVGLVKSFAFAGFWNLWWEERGESGSRDDIDIEVLAAYMVWLRKVFPGVVDTVSTTHAKLAKLMTRQSTQVESGDGEEESSDED